LVACATNTPMEPARKVPASPPSKQAPIPEP
jgi:hypothetical protein